MDKMTVSKEESKRESEKNQQGRKNNVLISFVPTIALEMIDSALKEGGDATFSAPYKVSHFGVCGLLDISGFTKISDTFGKIGSVGTEQIIKVLNRYFNQLIETLMEIDCDILKFAGDALLLYWPCTRETMMDAVANATFQLISICEKTETFSPATENNVLAASDSSTRRDVLEQTIQLFCHAGLTVGDMTFHILGGLNDRHEFVVTSPVLTTEIANSVDKSKVREVVVGPSAWDAISSMCDCEDRGDGYFLVKKIDWTCKKLEKAYEVELSDPRAFALVRTFVPVPMHSFLDYEEKNVLGEFRDIVVLFAGFNPTGTLQELFYNVQELTRKNGGMIRQFILDDKGYVVICGWGLPKFAQKNSEQLAVTTGLAFANKSLLQHAADVNVGITFGRVYCGQVGGEMRKEYAMVGDTVNTAARLMASKASPILVDYHVKTSTSSSFNYDHLEPIQFKGKNAPMPVFVPHKKEFKKGQVQEDVGFYGQTHIKEALNNSLNNVNKLESGSFHLVTGNSGMGKSMVMKFLHTKCAQDEISMAHFCGRQIEEDTSFFLLAEMFHHFAPQNHQEQKELVQKLLDEISQDKEHQQNLLFPAMAYLLRLQWVFDPESESPATVFHSSTTIPMLERSSAIKQVERQMTKYITDTILPNIQVLMVDDCQFFDPNSFDVLYNITEAMIKAKNVVIIFTRPLKSSATTRAEIAKLKSLTTTSQDLIPFEKEVVSEILDMKVEEHLAGENNTEINFRPGMDDFEDVLGLIMRESKGNPFWVMNFVNIFKVVVAKGEHKNLFDNSFNDAKSQAFGVLNRVILMEFDGFSSAQQELLKTASTIGTVFEIRILKKVLPVTFRRKHNFETQMKLLIDLGVIQNYDHEKKDWFCEFVHDLTRRAIESLIPPSKLSMIHKQVAETYEYFYQDDLRPLFPRLAYHHDKSGMANESFVYLRLAATTELQLDSVQQGMEMLERAIAVINNNNENLESKMQKVEQLVMLLRSCLKDAGFSEEFLISEEETYDNNMSKKSLSNFSPVKYQKLLSVLRALQKFQKQSGDDTNNDNVVIKRKVSSWKIMPALQDGDMDSVRNQSKREMEDEMSSGHLGELDPSKSTIFCTIL